jgi:prevent-host-death family protein
MGTKRQNDSVSAFDAKTHLSQLLKEAEQGRSITITKRGRPVARLVPIEPEQAPLGYADVLKGFEEIRGRVKGKVDIRALINEGRKR